MPQGSARNEPSAQFIVDELKKRGHQVEWINRWAFHATVAGQKITFWSTRSVLNTQIASALCRRKNMTNRILRDAGVKIPEGSVFTSAQRKRALTYASSRWPVVVKPANSPGKGLGVSVGVSTPEKFRSAFVEAAKIGPPVMVQEVVRGTEARMLVVGGRCVSVVRKLVNPETGSTIGYLQFEEITKKTHPFYLREAERAVAAFPGLGLAGLDVMAEDWTKPGKYAVIEINSAPGIWGHHSAQQGTPFNAAGAIVDELESKLASTR